MVLLLDVLLGVLYEVLDLPDKELLRAGSVAVFQYLVKVLGMEGNTKVLLLVDEVGSINFTELGKSLGVPKGQATKCARELHKLGVLEIKGETAKSTLSKMDIKEGEVKVD